NIIKLIGPLLRRVIQPALAWAGKIPAIQQAIHRTASSIRQHFGVRWMFIALAALLGIRLYVWLFSWIDPSPRWRGIIIAISLIVAWSWLPLRLRVWSVTALFDRRPTTTEHIESARAAALPLLVIPLSLIGLFYDVYGLGPAIPLACFFIACAAFNNIVVEQG